MTKLRYKDGSGNWVSIAPSQKEHDDLKSQLEQTERQTTTLSTGVAVVNAEANAPARVEIEGRTLIGGGNTPLETGKKYVLADKKTKVIVDGVTHSGVAKFTKTGEAGRATIIRVADFAGKISGSNLESPHIAKGTGNASLILPSLFVTEVTSYTDMGNLDGKLSTSMSMTKDYYAQRLFSFNLIEAIERNIGRIPRTTTTDKIAWNVLNIAELVANFHGNGSSPSGNKIYFKAWNGTAYDLEKSHTSGAVSQLAISLTDLTNRIDVNGFVHFLAHADASNGTIASTINTDYISLDIKMAQNADFTHPKVPLYEVADDSYNKLLVDWDADEVVRRYPAVESFQHLQGVGVFAEGDNLLPPFTEWTLHANAKVISPYELELNTTGSSPQRNTIDVNVLPNQAYILSCNQLGVDRVTVIRQLDTNNNIVSSQTVSLEGNVSITTTTATNVKKLRIEIGNISLATSLISKNPMLTLGTVAKPFVPRNTSSVIADVKLGAIGDKKDILHEKSGRWEVYESTVKDETLTLSGSVATLAINASASSAIILDKATGEMYKRVVTLSGTGKEFTQGGTNQKTITFNATSLPTTPLANYVRATAITTDVTDKVEGSLKVNNLTQVSVDAGYRRTVTDGKSTWTKGSKVDYTTNPVAVKLTYAKNIRGAMDDAVSKLEDNSTMLSVHEKSLIDLYVRIKALEVKP